MSQTVRPRLLFLSACAGILVFGIVLAILGTVFGLPAMRARLHVSLGQQGTLFLLLYLGIFVASLVVGPLIDHLGNKANLLTSSLIVALAMVFFAGAHSFATASGAAILLGLGGGGLNTCTNALVSDLYAAQRGPMLNRLGIFFGVGAISIPLMAASIEGHFTIPQLFLFCAVLATVCALWYAAISFPSAKAKRVFSWGELLEVAKYNGVLLLAFILFLESGNGMHRRLDIHVCGRHRILPASCHAGVGSVLGCSHAGPIAGGANVARDRKIAARGEYGIPVPGRVRRPALRTITDPVVCRDCVDWIVLWADLPDDTGDCG